jgi:hypothetical protein
VDLVERAGELKPMLVDFAMSLRFDRELSELGDVVVLFNVLDEFTYRTRSNLGRRAFKPLRKGMVVITRLVRAGGDWMVSGNLAAWPASDRDEMLALTAEYAVRNPKVVFRNLEKLAEARRILAEHHRAFVELFGTDLIVVPGTEVPGTFEEFHRHLVRQIEPDAEPVAA